MQEDIYFDRDPSVPNYLACDASVLRRLTRESTVDCGPTAAGRSFAPEECADLSPLKVSKLIDVLLREIDSRASSADLRKGLGP